MTDTLTILRHARNPMAKQWLADGSIGQYGDGKFFKHTGYEAEDLGALAGMLKWLATEPTSCVIRGKYVGDDVAQWRDPEFKPGMVRRALDYFDDQPLHSVMLDVDKFVPLTADPVLDPEDAVLEFIHTALPSVFRGAGHFWQLSNSAGHPSKADGKLRAHIWFWLETPYTSAALKAWAAAEGVEVDLALFNPVQIHYTSDPVMAAGVTDPVAQRVGFVPGPSVQLVIEPGAVPTKGGGRGQRLRDIAATDPIAQVLAERGMIKSQVRDGFNIECPFEDGHTPGSGGETSTQYFLPNTGGHVLGHFKCLHASCSERTRGQFLARLGINEVIDDFGVVSDEEAGVVVAPPAVGGAGAKAKVKQPPQIPQALHLCTDQANAHRLVRKFGKSLAVVGDKWLAWDGAYWQWADFPAFLKSMRLSQIIKAEADGWRAKPVKDAAEAEKNAAVAKALDAWGAKSENHGPITAAVALTKKSLVVSARELDKDPWLLNCLNGTVDLRTGVLKDHDPGDYITHLVPVEYEPEAKCPVWQEVLLKVTREVGRPATPVASFLQRWFGYCSTGFTREQVFCVHYGAGANGKSTVLDTVASVLGDYAGTAAPGMLVGGGKDRHPTEIADLMGRRMMTAHETGEGGVLREDFVKQATGGDKLKARLMRQDFFEFDPTHKLQLLTNHKPTIKGQDHGIWRRVLLVPWEARWGSAEDVAAGMATYPRDDSLERIQTEKQGILAWIVKGAMDWAASGLRAPDVVMAASRDYRAEQDRMAQFIAECCEVGPGHEVVLSDDFGGLYQVYREWCQEAGTFALSKRRMLDEVQRVLPSIRREERKVREGAEKRKDRVFLVGLRTLK